MTRQLIAAVNEAGLLSASNAEVFIRMKQTMEELAESIQRAHFALLDLIPSEARDECSWEVEREEFMRGMTTDPRDEASGI